MNTTAANLSVWVGETLVWIKIAGRATFTSSVDFKALINQLWQKGHSQFRVDLTDCMLMDSTFLGVLSGLGLKFSHAQPKNRRQHRIVSIPTPAFPSCSENLGVSHLFKVINERRRACGKLAPSTEQCAPPDRKEVQRTCLEAHQTLMGINPNNVPKFKDSSPGFWPKI